MLNGQTQAFEGSTLVDVLKIFDFEGKVVATAVNDTFIPVGMRASCLIKDGDRIEVLAPMQGG
jgi:sulfur carrier protein